MKKYLYIAEQLIKKSQSTESKLPTEVSIMKTYNVSRQTVRKALSHLRERGLIVSIQGSGSYLTGRSLDPDKNVIPIILSSETGYIFPKILQILNEQLEEQGYSSKAYFTHSNTCTERLILEELFIQKPRALIIECCKSALPNPNSDLYLAFDKLGTKLLFMHNHYPQLNLGICIRDDNYYGGYLLASHLIQHGHQKIAGFFQMDESQGLERYHGFLCCMRDHKIPVTDAQIGWFHTNHILRLRSQNDTQFIRDFVQESLLQCSSVICYNDEIAYFVLKELDRLNLQVPEHKSVVSFDNSYLCELTNVPLTSLSHADGEIPKTVVKRLMEQLKGLPVSSQEVPWKLISRKSVAEPFILE